MKLAVKLLKRSDLTFFEPRYRLVNAGNQKSLNLNRSVLIDQFYPALADNRHKALLPVTLNIWGPAAAGRLRLSRSITKEAKNWRLNGEFVHNPDVEPSRFDALAPDDIALLRFDGAAAPHAVSLVLISAGAPAESLLHSRLVPLAGNSMRVIDAESLLEALEGIDPDHPARLLVTTDAELADIQDAAAGDPAATARTMTRRNLSREDVAAARERASETGAEGETLVAHWLAQQQEAGGLARWRWASEENALSPFDFSAQDLLGRDIHIEVKTTTAKVPRPFHISLAEVAAAATVAHYDLYRVSALNDGSGVLRRSENIAGWAQQLLAALAALPPGIIPQDFLVEEAVFAWSEPETILLPGEDGDEA
ncbi:DUF3883 domain-containing protein [Sphingomonas sp. MAH-20]|uniref:DUF3883 domain-containing protein n=1 Tax=Sphingomonas horti TaxID=2682842 RepID=A0A6I4IZQ1_9SPHN|nr:MULTISPECIES: DUF3883 domain-containing protein [Sphingomonas]MBA2920638.1 DUF3883 domain-containing protein [Sphingomonas sp. CGMCC 1.13658]MVO77574.1 DUF3883 domain-containing protein [Sphingomonas horti]